MNGRSLHITLFFVLLLFAACTERSLEIRKKPVPIRLYTSILTRAVVGDFDNTPIRIAYGAVSGHYTEYWDGIATGDEIILTPERYYPEDGSPVYLCSYHPLIPAGSDGMLTCELTGSEDLMAATEISGSLSEPFTRTPEKEFTHVRLLTQLKFKACKRNATGVAGRIYSIRVNEAYSTVSLSLLSMNKPVFSNPTGVTLTPGSGTSEQGVEVPADGSMVAVGELMVPPFSLSDGYTLDVETSFGTIRSLKLVTDMPEDTDFAAGTSHEVTLWISDTGLGILSVTLSKWEPVNVDGNIELRP